MLRPLYLEVMKTALLSAPSSPAGQTSPSTAPRREKPPHQEIADRARTLWNKYGCPSGRDEEIWLEAERQLIGTVSETGIAQSPAVKPKTESTSTPAKSAQGGGGRRAMKNDEEEFAIAGQGVAARGGRRRSAT